MYKQQIIDTKNNIWVVCEEGKDYTKPADAVTFAFDTETITYIDGQIKTQDEIFELLKGLKDNEKRARLSNNVWAWQAYDEVNGFFMTNDFITFLVYCCRCKYAFGWCYNATFDFAQIDYKILAEGADLWKPHEKKTGKAYNKGQAWTYESLHNDAGARYAYKLWVEYYNTKDRHKYVHAIQLHDFMKLVTGGLKNVLEGLNVKDNEGNPVRKLNMDYQAVQQDALTQDEIAYCCNDVKGLYFAVKQFNESIEAQTGNECHIYGKDTNIMTAGGLAKRQLLRALYPNKAPKYRIKQYQKEHYMTEELDKYLRDAHLYRGGVSFVNPKYKGQLLTAERMGLPMYRYDVNSEYPYSMASIRDLIGAPIKKPFSEWLNASKEEREQYEAIYILQGVTGEMREGMLPIWYDPFKHDFTEYVEEEGEHLIFEREYEEMLEWYDLEANISEVILFRRGDYIYKNFVDTNYELKADAKKEGNKVLQQYAKLILNSSYGKLSERVQRRIGKYELNEETGAVHFVETGTETDAHSIMSVAVGALVTCFARCYILGKIREVCGSNGANVCDTFVYIDTDSIHAFASYDKADAFTLGGLKLEATCKAVKYIAPKTYIDIEQCEGNIIPRLKNSKGADYYPVEVHSKGLSTSVIQKDFLKQKTLTIDYVASKINYGVKYVCLCAMNVKGGKVLIPIEKYIARIELAPAGFVLNNGYDGTILNER